MITFTIQEIKENLPEKYCDRTFKVIENASLVCWQDPSGTNNISCLFLIQKHVLIKFQIVVDNWYKLWC